ncbi:MAG: hypothetical protein ACU0BB_15955 [Paracoccaceae bacterium]
MPVTEMPDALVLRVMLPVILGVASTHFFTACDLKLCGLPLFGNLPMECEGVPFEETQSLSPRVEMDALFAADTGAAIINARQIRTGFISFPLN